MKRLKCLATSTAVTLLLAACGGSSGGSAVPQPPPPPPPPPPPAITMSEAFRFLNQATFGATEPEAQAVIDMGYADWIADQMLQPTSLQLPHVRSIPTPQFPFLRHNDRIDIWFRNVVNGPDQLRQRVAFALSEIMVVSQVGALFNLPFAATDYYDVLAENAFGNYRDLIEEVTLHPAMGVYLSMLGNEKPDPALNIRPDENYARELMQLFSVGLVELNIDGSQVLNTDNSPVPTYNQAVIEGFAHVFTGWHFAGAQSFPQANPNPFNQAIPMQLYPDFHDTGEKLLLNGAVQPAGMTGEQDLQAALDNIFNHQNVAPFIATRLIQRLVTSNPSPQYIARVAGVFADNGFGVRGDLGSVVRAILLDTEARSGQVNPESGKLKEPLIRLTQLYRAYDAAAASGKFLLPIANFIFGQGPLQSPSVFNFFSPFYAPPGEIRDVGWVAPELEIATEYQNTLVTNYMFFQILGLNSLTPNVEEDQIIVDIDAEAAVAADSQALVDLVAEKLLAGEISTTLEQEVIGMVNRVPATDVALRAAEAIYLVATSPEFAYQR